MSVSGFSSESESESSIFDLDAFAAEGLAFGLALGFAFALEEELDDVFPEVPISGFSSESESKSESRSSILEWGAFATEDLAVGLAFGFALALEEELGGAFPDVPSGAKPDNDETPNPPRRGDRERAPDPRDCKEATGVADDEDAPPGTKEGTC